jgi:hypothetical protein
MAAFNVVIDTKVFEQRLTKLEREQLPFARSLAANQAVFETRAVLQRAMPLFLDEPTPFTVSGVRYKKGTKDSPAAEIYISDDAAKGTSPKQYLQALIRGQRRRQKRSERVLARAGLISDDEGWVPATRTSPNPPAIRLNRYGNVTGGKITEILSGIRAFGEEGFQANITATSRARGKKRRRAEYFVSRGGKLPRGIYQRFGRRSKARHKYNTLPAGRPVTGRQIRPVLLFVKLPVYSKQFDFYGIAEKEGRRRFLQAWPAALRRALATARR